MRVEIIYMDRTKDAEEFECDYVNINGEQLYLNNVVHPFEASRMGVNLNNVDYYVEYEEDEE